MMTFFRHNKTALVLSIILFVSCSAAQKSQSSSDSETVKSNELVWLEFNEGLALAKKTKKILLVDCYTDWCYWCKVMDQKTYTDSAIIAKINEYYVPVKFNPEKNGSFKIGDKTYSNSQLLSFLSKGPNYGYPTTFFWVNPEANNPDNIHLAIGYQDISNFNNQLNRFINLSKKP
jgi:thiol:disulfide interchange protein